MQVSESMFSKEELQMKKSLNKSIVSILLLGLLCGMFFGCKDDRVTPPAEDVFQLTKENISEYVIVIPMTADTEVASAARQLKELIKDATGADLTVKTDRLEEGSEVYCEQEYEILVGNTNRAESKAFHDGIKQNDSGYVLSGKKLIIGGFNATTVGKSVALWNMEFLKKADMIMLADTKKVINGAYTYDTLTVNGTSIKDFNIVYPKAGTNGEMDIALKLCEILIEKTGFVIECIADDVVSDQKEIIIGQTETVDAELLSERTASGFGDQNSYIAANDRCVWLSGNSANTINSAVIRFLSLITADGKSASIEIDGAKKYEMQTLEISAMTYNILFNSLSDARTAALLSVIENADSDIFGCNEVVPYWTEKLTEKFSSVYDTVDGKSVNALSDGARNSVFWKKDRFDLIESGTLWLSDTPQSVSKYPNSKQYRTCTYVKLREKASGIEFVFISTHLENTGTTEDSVAVATREKQSRALKKIADSFAFVPVIIGGDFNSGSVAKGITPLVTDSRYTDAYEIAADKTGKATYPGKGWRLDYIFVTKDSIAVKSYTVINCNSSNSFPSDHLPVKIQAVISQ